MISINSKRTPPPHQGTFNHRLTQAGLLLAVFAASLSLTACPSPNATPKPKAWHVTTFAGNDITVDADGIGTEASFKWPSSIAQSGDTLYVTVGSAHSIRTIDITTARVGTIVNSKGVSGAHADGVGTLARFNHPRGIVAEADSTLYVADYINHRIRKVLAGTNAATTQVNTLAGSGTPGDDNNAEGIKAQFRFPMDLALSGRTLYVADRNNHCIRTVDLASTDNTVDTIAGECGTSGRANGAGSTARFNNPSGLAVSGTTLYVADFNNNRIRAVDLTSKTVSTIAGSGTEGDHADGAGSTARFNGPIGLAVSGTTLYVADFNNNRIRAIDLTNKTVSTIAGDGEKKNTDGIGTAAQFYQPIGIAVSGSTLYVTSGTRIRKLEYR